jgi:hypothetical protein
MKEPVMQPLRIRAQMRNAKAEHHIRALETQLRVADRTDEVVRFFSAAQ